MTIKATELRVWSIVTVLSVARLVGAGSELQLVKAVQQGDREAVSFLLKGDTAADVNVSQADGTTALSKAVSRDDLEMVALLIDAGADVNAANVYRVTPLSLACANGNAAIVEKLLKAGADPNAARVTGETPLMTCSRTGNVDAVKLLVARGADVNATEAQRGQTALMWAAAQRHSAVVRALVARGADVHARSKRLPLYTPRIPDPVHFSPTGAPVHQGFTKNVYFPKFKGGLTPLMFAAQSGDVESAQILLASGADVNESTPEEGTALVLASSSGREKMALFLLEKGANANAADCYGITALHWALQEGIEAISGVRTATDHFWLHPNMHELVRGLLARGANPNARIAKDFMPYHVHRFARGGNFPPQVGQAGATPFLLAAAAADIDAMRRLLENGADPKIATLEGTTSLMVAAGLGVERRDVATQYAGKPLDVAKTQRDKYLEAVELAWEGGVDVNAVGPGGRVAVHGAALYALTEVMQFLAEKSADLDAKDMYGQSALSIAMGDPDGLVYWGHIPDNDHDSTFRRRNAEDKRTAELLLRLGAAPYVRTYRDLKGY